MQDFGKGGSFWTILSKNVKFLNIHQNSHENEVILAKSGVRATPLNLLWIRLWKLLGVLHYSDLYKYLQKKEGVRVEQ